MYFQTSSTYIIIQQQSKIRIIFLRVFAFKKAGERFFSKVLVSNTRITFYHIYLKNIWQTTFDRKKIIINGMNKF